MEQKHTTLAKELIIKFEEDYFHLVLKNRVSINFVTEDLTYEFGDKGFKCIDENGIEHTLDEMDNEMIAELAIYLIGFELQFTKVYK